MQGGKNVERLRFPVTQNFHDSTASFVYAENLIYKLLSTRFAKVKKIYNSDGAYNL